MKSFLFIALLFLGWCDANTGGAGTCDANSTGTDAAVSGMSAVSGPPAAISGSGNFTMTVVETSTGANITVSGSEFHGFLFNVRDSNNARAGTFTTINASVAHTASGCPGNDSITHPDSNDHNPVTVVWVSGGAVAVTYQAIVYDKNGGNQGFYNLAVNASDLVTTAPATTVSSTAADASATTVASSGNATSAAPTGTIWGACSNTNDTALIVGSSTWADLVYNCTVASLGVGSTTATCLETSSTVTTACAACFGDAVTCGATNCLSTCLADARAQVCLDCQATNCNSALVTCSGIAEADIPALAPSDAATTVSPTLSADATNITSPESTDDDPASSLRSSMAVVFSIVMMSAIYHSASL